MYYKKCEAECFMHTTFFRPYFSYQHSLIAGKNQFAIVSYYLLILNSQSH